MLAMFTAVFAVCIDLYISFLSLMYMMPLPIYSLVFSLARTFVVCLCFSFVFEPIFSLVIGLSLYIDRV